MVYPIFYLLCECCIFAWALAERRSTSSTFLALLVGVGWMSAAFEDRLLVCFGRCHIG